MLGLPHDVQLTSCSHALALVASWVHMELFHALPRYRHAAISAVTQAQSGLAVQRVAPGFDVMRTLQLGSLPHMPCNVPGVDFTQSSKMMPPPVCNY